MVAVDDTVVAIDDLNILYILEALTAESSSVIRTDAKITFHTRHRINLTTTLLSHKAHQLHTRPFGNDINMFRIPILHIIFLYIFLVPFSYFSSSSPAPVAFSKQSFAIVSITTVL